MKNCVQYKLVTGSWPIKSNLLKETLKLTKTNDE